MVQVGGLLFLESLGPSNGISLEIVPPGRVSTNHNIEQRQTFDFETSSWLEYLMIAICCGPQNFFHESPTIQDDWDMRHVLHILWYQLVINHSPNWKQPSYMYIHPPPWNLTSVWIVISYHFIDHIICVLCIIIIVHTQWLSQNHLGHEVVYVANVRDMYCHPQRKEGSP